ncbi:hypothetical protein GCM10027167_34750 [Nocardia heshunensis]
MVVLPEAVVARVAAERVSDTALSPGAGWALGDSGLVRSFSGGPSTRGERGGAVSYARALAKALALSVIQVM